MKKIATLVSFLALLAPGAALAQPGIDLAWDDCLGGGGTLDRTVACANNNLTIVNKLFHSFVLAEPVSHVALSETITDVQVDAASLSSWWTANGRFQVTPGTSGCAGWFDASSGAVSALLVSQTGPTKFRIRVDTGLATPGEEASLDAGIEYLTDVVELRYNSGTFENPGCLTPACFTFQVLSLYPTNGAGSPLKTLETPGISNYVTWRGGGSVQCPIPTTTRPVTWGSIKSLYR